jgi:hypothetical protein
VLGKERLESLTIHHGWHTFISHALAGRRTLAEVRDAAGHANVTITSWYLYVAVKGARWGRCLNDGSCCQDRVCEALLGPHVGRAFRPDNTASEYVSLERPTNKIVASAPEIGTLAGQHAGMSPRSFRPPLV